MTTPNILSAAFYSAAYIAFFLSVFRTKELSPSFTAGVLIFMTIQFGPHTAILTDQLELSSYAWSKNLNFYYNLFAGAFFLFTATILSLIPKSNIIPRSHQVIRNPREMEQLYLPALAIFFALAALSIYLQGGLNITLTHLQYIVGGSFFSYKEIRRELFTGSSWTEYAAIIRYTLAPLIYGYFLTHALTTKNRPKQAVDIAIMIASFFVLAIQLNKFYFVYYILFTTCIIYSHKVGSLPRLRLRSNLKPMIAYALVAAGIIQLVKTLYNFQYSDIIQRGGLTSDDIADTLYFRIFFASSDALRLWIDSFILAGTPIGFAGTGKLCSILAEQCINVNTEIPYIYMGNTQTSLQSGPMGSAIAAFGMQGIPVLALVTCLILVLNAKVQSLYSASTLLPVVATHLFLSAFFFTTRQIETAALSGGAVLMAIIYLAIHGYSRSKNLRRLTTLSAPNARNRPVAAKPVPPS